MAKTAAIALLLVVLSGCGPAGDEVTSLAAGDGAEPSDQEQSQPGVTIGSRQATNRVPAETDRFDPGGLLHSMALPIDVEAPDRSQISAIHIGLSRDETLREIYRLTIEVTSDEAPQDLIDALAAQPVLPRRGIDIPLPTFDHFYDWHDPSIRVESDGSGSLATISTSTRRQGKGEGTGIISGPTASLLQQVADDRELPMGASGSSLRWTTGDPHVIQASLSLRGTERTRTEVIDWLRAHAQPGTFQSTFAVSQRDDRIDGSIDAVLAGQPVATAEWNGGSYRDNMTIRFGYDIDDDGIPLPDQAVAVAPELPVLIPGGSEWRVDDDGAPDDGWADLGFDDADWRLAAAPLVRDEQLREAGWIATPASGDPAWFRHSFDLEDPAAITALEFSFQADDGAVAYLNGVELHRWNLPEGPIGAETLALTRISGEDEEVLHVVGGLPADLLQPGRNVLAVAVMQASTDSSDARFDAHLVGWP